MKTKRFVLIAAAIIGMAMSVSAQEAGDSKYGADSVSCVTNLSMYREYYKQWEAAKYAPEAISMEMVNAWRQVFLNCPRASQYVYTNGEKIMEYFIRTNPKQKDTYIDTLCMLMDSRAKYFSVDPKTGGSQVANIMGRKGLLIYTYNKRLEEFMVMVLPGGGQGGEGTSVETVPHGDDGIVFRPFLLRRVFAGHLDGAFVGFPAGIAEEHFLHAGFLTEYLRQLGAGLRVIQIGHVLYFAQLVDDSLFPDVVRDAEAGNADAGTHVNVFLAVHIHGDAALPADDFNREPGVGIGYVLVI